MYFPYADPSILFAILALALFILVPSALAAGFAILLFCLLDRIRNRHVQIVRVLAAGLLVALWNERKSHGGKPWT